MEHTKPINVKREMSRENVYKSVFEFPTQPVYTISLKNVKASLREYQRWFPDQKISNKQAFLNVHRYLANEGNSLKANAQRPVQQ